MTASILDGILQKKKEEVERLKETFRHEFVEQKKYSLYESFQQSTVMKVIAEMKRASPSKGDIHVTVDPLAQAKQYEQSGANAISVLTDEPFFKGKMEDLKNIREVVKLPILCKDFIIDPIQIDRAKQAGANVILLIAAALDDEQLTTLFSYAHETGLEVLLEVHDEVEMERALQLNAKIIGINNRDLKTFEVNLATTEKLIQPLKNEKDTYFISESGIRTKEDVERVRIAGASGILVGETLMRSKDINATLTSFKVEL
ncbi:indole-3-glycerol phosphate synthase [Oikeobacillus pervagus]|uniref:Indole-3-glycerol phosphate synthase n=1 Tax=Oikeobacillus pervagus TaxID=1325931 RepID=A0AAJ1T312_9BACI|nr:indole-3-glycerol phosphate synthase TrpC [Oikeobacillus pervagus]MDQ0214356.1 indole-3-glycerol phosphate synthase [Oikeobacillus pervagus]